MATLSFCQDFQDFQCRPTQILRPLFDQADARMRQKDCKTDGCFMLANMYWNRYSCLQAGSLGAASQICRPQAKTWVCQAGIFPGNEGTTPHFLVHYDLPHCAHSGLSLCQSCFSFYEASSYHCRLKSRCMNGTPSNRIAFSLPRSCHQPILCPSNKQLQCPSHLALAGAEVKDFQPN